MDELRPMHVRPFDQSQWYPVSYRHFGK
jgi:hypothetical protein